MTQILASNLCLFLVPFPCVAHQVGLSPSFHRAGFRDPRTVQVPRGTKSFAEGASHRPDGHAELSRHPEESLTPVNT